jgi:predicted transposase/invertase (TIGR01784 family)
MTNKEIFVPEILPPSEDGVFKTLLTHPDAKPVLRDVIASILRIPVTDVHVRNTELPISDVNEKRERLDVNCRTENGDQIDVEMQAREMKGDSAATGHENLKRRAIHHLCDLHASQAGRGIGSYGDLASSYQVTFCNFTVFPKREDFIARFGLRDEYGFLLSDAVGIVFVELPKLGATAKPVSELTSAEMWGIFFGHADDPKWKGLLNEMIEAKEEIRMANEILSGISKDERERAHYRSRKIFLMDMQHDMSTSRKEGIATVAKKLLEMRMPIADIAEATGLSRAEIESLRDGD